MARKTEIAMEADLLKADFDKAWLLPDKQYTEHVVGESFNNDDGTSRQSIIKGYAAKGATVDLEFYTYEGEPAARVMIAGKQIGNLSKHHAKEMYRHIKAGGFADIKVHSSKKAKSADNYGVILDIHRYIPQKTKEKLSMLPCGTCGKLVAKEAETCPNCGAPINKKDKSKAVSSLVKSQQKSRITSLILTVLFGPLGLLYSSVVGGVIMTVIALVGAPTVVVPVAAWVISIIWGDSATYGYNKRIENQAKAVSELV